MKKPLVSVIINNYNYAAYIGEAIESALLQTYENIEVIVVDDGSIDKSRDVINSFGEKIIPVFKDNGGQASAINAGFGASSGEIICLLDSDDIWVPQKVERVVAEFSMHSDAVAVYHRVIPVSEKLLPLGKTWPKNIVAGDVKKISMRAGGWWPYPPTSALSFRRQYLQNALPVPEDAFRICADAYLADLAPFSGTIYGYKSADALYRLHGNNQWNNSSRLDEAVVAMRIHKQRYETRVTGLNEALARLNITHAVSLDDHFPYQRLRWRLGEPISPVGLVLRAFRFPGHVGTFAKVKAAVRTTLEVMGVMK